LPTTLFGIIVKVTKFQLKQMLRETSLEVISSIRGHKVTL